MVPTYLPGGSDGTVDAQSQGCLGHAALTFLSTLLFPGAYNCDSDSCLLSFSFSLTLSRPLHSNFQHLALRPLPSHTPCSSQPSHFPLPPHLADTVVSSWMLPGSWFFVLCCALLWRCWSFVALWRIELPVGGSLWLCDGGG
jgi:hypothetical protein